MEDYLKRHSFVDVICNCKDKFGIKHDTFLGNFQIDVENCARWLCRNCRRMHTMIVDSDGKIIHSIDNKKEVLKTDNEFISIIK